MPTIASRSVPPRRGLAAVALASLSLAGGAAVAPEPAAAAAAKDRSAKAAKVVRKAGSTVHALQRALGIPADGVYGPQTRRAVKRFQREHDLTVDGIAGPQTLGALGVLGKASRSGSSMRQDLRRIARCESGGNPRAVSPGRRYFGKYQFSKATWRGVGGSGNPAKASEREQDRRARILYRRAGTSPWPTCGA